MDTKVALAQVSLSVIGSISSLFLPELFLYFFSKDVNGFFAFPVTDSIAPGYSSIIHSPMDFSTMESKIEKNEYHNVMEYKVSHQLILMASS